MNDTSFAIHPGGEAKSPKRKYYDIGQLLTYNQTQNVYSFGCTGGQVAVLFYRPDIVRIVMNPQKTPDLASSIALIAKPEPVAITMEERDQAIILRSEQLVLSFARSPFRLTVTDSAGRALVAEESRGMGVDEHRHVICYKNMEPTDHFYGFGEKTGFLDKRGERYTMWNSDVYAPHNPEIDALYQSIPYFMTLRDGKAHGIFFDNTHKTVFDMKTSHDTYHFGAEGGQLDYYILAGPTPKEVVEQYTWLTGRMPLPPKWALGYHQSRYSYASEQEVRELSRLFVAKQIPCDAVYLDIHYMDGYRVFTFDPDAFPNPKGMMEELRKAGIHAVPIVDPGVKEDPEYPIYQEGIQGDHFCKYIEGHLFHGDVWPGNSAFPDFTHEPTRIWWGEKHRFYTELGIEGIWNDMNEPAVFNETKTMDVKVMHRNDGQPKTHRELHNIYGMRMSEATYHGMKKLLGGKRPFLLTRAGFAGIQRYAAVWTGDNRSFWEHMAMAMPMCMNLGLSGVAFCGPDTGGFAHDANGELLVRWMQLGAFTPFFRNHSALGTVRQEPWAFGQEIETLVKKYIELRYLWLPHLYTLFAEASRTGVPIMRPLLFEYPGDANTYNLSDQFLLGDNVLIAPIAQPDVSHRVVYLPDGAWYDYWNDQMYYGGQHIMVKAGLDILPIFIKAGSVIAEGTVRQSTKVPDTLLKFHIYRKEAGTAQFTLYEDDGTTFAYEAGDVWERTVHCTFELKAVHIQVTDTGSYQPSCEECHLIIHGVEPDTTIIVNGKNISPEQMKVDKTKKTLTVFFTSLSIT
jgi:alpha-glucosidase